MAVPSTPTQFQLFDYVGQVLLTWQPSPTATGYAVFRSPITMSVTSVFSIGATSITVSSVANLVVGMAVADSTTGGNIQGGTTITAINATTKQITLNHATLGNSAASPGDTLSLSGTFVSIGTSTNTSFQDTTALSSINYYYYVQATNGSGNSASTPTLTGVAVLPGQTTLSNMRIEVQQRANKEFSPFYTTQELNQMVSQSYKEFYDIILQHFSGDYYIAPPVTYTTTGQIDATYQAQVFPLPADFYKLARCEVALNPADPNSWITLRQFNSIQANLYNYPNVYTFYGITNLRYRLWGTQLQIVPIASAGQTIRIWYAPKPSQLINDTDTVDCISGFEEYIVADVCEKMLVKEESFEQATAFAAQKADLLTRIESAAEARNYGEPQTVSDSKLRNFSWSSSGDYGGGGNGGYY